MSAFLSVKQSLLIDTAQQLAAQLRSDAMKDVRPLFRNYDALAEAALLDAKANAARDLRADVKRLGRKIEAEAMDSDAKIALAKTWRRKLDTGVDYALALETVTPQIARLLASDAPFGSWSATADGMHYLVRTMLLERPDPAALSLDPDHVAEGQALLLALHQEKGEAAVAKVERELAALALRPLLDDLAKLLRKYAKARTVAAEYTTQALPRVDTDLIDAALADADADIAGAPAALRGGRAGGRRGHDRSERAHLTWGCSGSRRRTSCCWSRQRSWCQCWTASRRCPVVRLRSARSGRRSLRRRRPGGRRRPRPPARSGGRKGPCSPGGRGAATCRRGGVASTPGWRSARRDPPPTGCANRGAATAGGTPSRGTG
jgi:hypothetical protein